MNPIIIKESIQNFTGINKIIMEDVYAIMFNVMVKEKEMEMEIVKK